MQQTSGSSMCCGVGEEAVDEGFVVVVSFLLSSLSLPPSCLGCGGGGDEVVVVVVRVWLMVYDRYLNRCDWLRDGLVVYIGEGKRK